MDDFSRKFRSIDWKSFQKSARRMQQSTASALKDLVMTDLENKTRATTADTPWGASTTDLRAIAQGTYNRDDYALIMSIVWQRLASSRWRCVYKSLELLKFLVMHGSSRCLEEARSALGHIESLTLYRKVEGGRDVGEGVRKRAEGLVEMLRDESVLVREREKSDELRRKMLGDGGSAYSGYDHGTYDDSYDEGHVSRIGTSGFKGYDDQPGSFKGYDDEPSFKGYDETPTKTKVPVDDLLGGDPGSEPVGAAETNDDDDEFDPRGSTEQQKSDDAGDMFGALALTETKQGTVATVDMPQPSAGNVTAESTSALVARLAAEKSKGGGSNADTQTRSIWDDEPAQAKAGPGAGIWAEPAVARKPHPVSKKDDDPFGELVQSARKVL